MRRLKPDPVPDELIAKILRAGICAPNGGNTQKWRFLVVKDPQDQEGGAGLVQEGLRRGDRPALPARARRRRASPRRRYLRQHAAVEYLTDHFHEAPVWIVACLEDGPHAEPRWRARRSIRRCRTWCWRRARWGWARR